MPRFTPYNTTGFDSSGLAHLNARWDKIMRSARIVEATADIVSLPAIDALARAEAALGAGTCKVLQEREVELAERKLTDECLRRINFIRATDERYAIDAINSCEIERLVDESSRKGDILTVQLLVTIREARKRLTARIA